MSEKGRGSVRGVVSAVGLFSSGRERERAYNTGEYEGNWDNIK